MTELPDYNAVRARLLQSGDSEVAKVVRVFDAVFRSAKMRPGDSSFTQAEQISDAVTSSFPTPFARKFLGWVDLDVELAETLDQLADASDAARRDRLEQRARLRFRNALLEIETCWRQIVHFVPFILMAALRRLDDADLQKHAGSELAQALYHYNTFYGRYETERQREADQLHLLVYLLRVFRKLGRAAKLEGTVLFSTPASELFPERFDASMRLLQQVRNRIVHGRVADRVDAAHLVEVISLVRWCFLDAVSALEPICGAFSLAYVLDLAVGGGDVEAETLEYVGASGPTTASYRISSQPQVELFAFTRHRLYLIRRGKRIAGGTGEVLGPGDYLDLTPFLIADRVRQARAAETTAPQLLFALQQYLEPVRQLLFSDLGGSGDNQRPTGTDDWEATRLLDQVQWFKDRIGQLTARIGVKTGVRIDHHAMRAILWRVSKEQLAGLMDVRLYDETGTIRTDAEKRDMRTVYDADLYVEPLESGRVAGFLRSGRRGMLLVGGSGFGKSNLLVHHYLAAVQANGLAVFVGGRRFATSDVREALLETVAREISREWTSLESLDAYLEETGQTLLVAIDALNEYSGPRGPLPLLASLVAAAHDPVLRRVKLLATCRTETWNRYRQEYGGDRPLDPASFETDQGDAVKVGGFDEPSRLRRLFDSYRDFYDLDAGGFDRLGPSTRALLAQPFMMAIVAETYSNRGRPADGPPRTAMPPVLDYFALFEELTERKCRDAQLLVPATERLQRDALPTEMRAFCRDLAAIVYDRLAAPDGDGSGLDAVPFDVVDKRAELQPYLQRRGTVSVLDAVLQVGLVDEVRTQQRDAEGRLVHNTAIAFFHDQYTQYWLGAAYQKSILGWLDPPRLASPGALDELVGRISVIVERSAYAPVLAGALDHWMQRNILSFHRGKLEPIIPLLDRLAAAPSAAVRFQVAQTMSTFMVRGFLSPRDVFQPVFDTGTQALRLELAGMFVEFWPTLSPAAVQAMIDACDPERDQPTLDKLGDIFVLHLLQNPGMVVDYLDQAIRPLSWTSIVEPMRLYRQSRFMQQFGIFGFILSFDNPERIGALRQFFRAKYKPVIDLITGAGTGLKEAAFRQVRRVLFRRAESFGVDQWNRFISFQTESGNDRFFTEVDGVVQRDMLRELLPYLVELHDGDSSRLSLDPASPFRALIVRMLDFRIMSVIGYNALLCLPTVLLRVPWGVTESLVMELIERRSRSTLFYGNLLLCNLAYSDKGFAAPALVLMRDRIVPMLLREGLDCDWSITFCIATLDVDGLWPIQSAILDQLFDAMETVDDPGRLAGFREAMIKICLTHDIALGRRAVEKLLADTARFLAPHWRTTTMAVFAAMLTRSPGTLIGAVRGAGLPESLVAEARENRTSDVVEQSRLWPLQVDINRFVAWLYLDEPRLRYTVVKHFIGSLACGDSVEDFAVGVRRMVVAIMSVFLGDSPDTMPRGRITIPEIEADVASARRERERRGRLAS